MKRFLIAWAALGLVLAGPAFAEEGHHDHDASSGHGTSSSTGHGNGQGTTGGHMTFQAGQTGHATVNQPVVRPNVTTKPIFQPQIGHGAAFTGQMSHRHVDFGKFHRNIQAARHYHLPVYTRPQGWYVHRWVYGDRLPPAFFARNYWLGDWAMFGLMPPPDGCVWVRVGDDALLIDEYDGEVIQVVYGLFY